MKTTTFLKNGLRKKSVENFMQLSNGTNKSIANFRETIPLKLRIGDLPWPFAI
jgi:hypothetical protein